MSGSMVSKQYPSKLPPMSRLPNQPKNKGKSKNKKGKKGEKIKREEYSTEEYDTSADDYGGGGGYSSANLGYSSLDSDSDAGYGDVNIRIGNIANNGPPLVKMRNVRDDDNMSTNSFGADTIATEASHNLTGHKKPLPPRGLPPSTALMSPTSNLDPDQLELNSIAEGMFDLESRVGQNLDRLLRDNLNAMTVGGDNTSDKQPTSARGKKRHKRMQQLHARPVKMSDLARDTWSVASSLPGDEDNRVQSIPTPRSIGSIESNGSAGSPTYNRRHRNSNGFAKDDRGPGSGRKDDDDNVSQQLFVDDIEDGSLV
jgi:hypothetical protein